MSDAGEREQWLLKPAGPDEYKVFVTVGEAAEVPPKIHAAIEQLLQAVEAADAAFAEEQACHLKDCHGYCEGKCSNKCIPHAHCSFLLLVASEEDAAADA
jgi:hypothetical protein